MDEENENLSALVHDHVGRNLAEEGESTSDAINRMSNCELLDAISAALEYAANQAELEFAH